MANRQAGQARGSHGCNGELAAVGAWKAASAGVVVDGVTETDGAVVKPAQADGVKLKELTTFETGVSEVIVELTVCEVHWLGLTMNGLPLAVFASVIVSVRMRTAMPS